VELEAANDIAIPLPRRAFFGGNTRFGQPHQFDHRPPMRFMLAVGSLFGRFLSECGSALLCRFLFPCFLTLTAVA